jgi:hypothetical protein
MKLIPSEHQIQSTFFESCAWRARRDVRWSCVFAIPNGGLRHIAVGRRLKKEGVRSGVPDVFVAVPSGGKHGLFIEFKQPGNRMTAAQKIWKEMLWGQGYHVDVCFSAEEGVQLVESYLGER